MKLLEVQRGKMIKPGSVYKTKAQMIKPGSIYKTKAPMYIMKKTDNWFSNEREIFSNSLIVILGLHERRPLKYKKYWCVNIISNGKTGFLVLKPEHFFYYMELVI